MLSLEKLVLNVKDIEALIRKLSARAAKLIRNHDKQDMNRLDFSRKNQSDWTRLPGD